MPAVAFFDALENKVLIKIESSLGYTPGTKRVASDGSNFPDLVPGQYSSVETSQRWRGDGDTASDGTSPVIQPKTCHHDNVILNYVNRPVLL